METRTEPQRPNQQRPPDRTGRGAPPTYAAHAVRRDVSVRVSVSPPSSEPEELREPGYGHGV